MSFVSMRSVIEPGTREATRRRHAEWYRHLAESMEYGTGTTEGVERLRAELSNLEAALAWAVEKAEADIALSLANYRHGLWYIVGRFDESRAWFSRVLALRWQSAPQSQSHELGEQPRAGSG
jgi:predicted ATPase